MLNSMEPDCRQPGQLETGLRSHVSSAGGLGGAASTSSCGRSLRRKLLRWSLVVVCFSVLLSSLSFNLLTAHWRQQAADAMFLRPIGARYWGVTIHRHHSSLELYLMSPPNGMGFARLEVNLPGLGVSV